MAPKSAPIHSLNGEDNSAQASDAEFPKGGKQISLMTLKRVLTVFEGDSNGNDDPPSNSDENRG